MRVTGGQAKGIPIKAPKGVETRPTSDKVREAVFQTLGRLVEEARVLDLFAGSGALGIEALSRGAEFCVFVDKASAATRIIEDNLVKAGFRERAEVIRSDFRSAVRLLSRSGENFNLILLDPPYGGDLLEQTAAALDAHPLTGARPIIVVEHFKKDAPPAAIGGITPTETRFYGQTAITYYFGV
jgi:16S rRNA (guanine(966)-N(2))-methyltransferase RsmD